MGELARQRRSRDLWVSRQHLWALGVGVGLLVVGAFFAGYGLSRGGVPEAPAAASTGAPSESLVDLLARVDTRVVAQDGVDTLTFPDTLTGVGQDPGLPEPLAPQADPSHVSPGHTGSHPADLVLSVDDVEEGEALTALLRARGWQVELAVGQDEGPELVVVGGDDVAQAREARERLLDDLDALDQARPVGISLR